MKRILLFIVVLAFGRLADAQVTVSIGGAPSTFTTATQPSPVNRYFGSEHHQIVYTKAEINAAGFTGAGLITKLGWYPYAFTSGDPLLNYSIKMKHTTAVDASAHDAGSFTTVYTAASYTPTTGGFDMLTLNPGFQWNGTDNIVIDVCNDNSPNWTTNGQLYYYNATAGSRYVWLDASSQCAVTTATANSYKPLVRFIIQGSATPPVAMFFSPPNSCMGSIVTLINNSINPSTYQWTITPGTFSYVNGTSASSKNPAVKFLDSVNYTVKLKVSNFFGADSTTKTIQILGPQSVPTAEFFTPVRVIPRLNPPMTFTDLSTNCPQVWAWSSPDYEQTYFYNPFIDSTQQNGQAFFAFSGIFDICLRVTNSLGSSTTCKQDYITVMDAIQHCTDTISTSSAGFITDEGGPGGNYANNRSLCTSNPCPANSCKGILIDPCASSVTLNFTQVKLATGAGDSIFVHNGVNASAPRILALGSAANGTFPTVTANSGKMFIYMISNASGTDSGFTAKWSSVSGSYGRPSAGFTINQQKCMPQDTFSSGFPLKYVNTTTGVDVKYTWDVNGDAYPDSTVANPSTALYNFTSFPERYTIMLLAYNCKGIDTFYKVVTIMPVNAKPTQVDFIADKTAVSAQDTISLTDLSCGATQWEWNFTPSINVRYVAGYNKFSQNPKIMLSGVGCIRVSMKAKNSAGEDSLIKTCYLKIRNYCVPASISSPVSDIGINKVIFAGINNSSASGTVSYVNYYDSAFAVGNSYKTIANNLTIQRNTNANNVNYKAWIDFNLDGDFDDAGEEVLTKLNQSGTSVSQSVVIPANAVVGSTIMRVGVSAAASFLTSCAAQLGEFEDYKVNILNDLTKPVITKNGNDTIYMEQYGSYTDPGATAYDNIEGDITSKIIKTGSVDTALTGYFSICYDVKDAYGNAADTKCRTVAVTVDRTPPVITLLGKNPDTVLVGNVYVDPGATAFDNYSGNLTSKIQTINNVNKDVVGMYTITYKVSDYFGFTDTKVRTVYVADNQKPVINRNTTTTNHIHLVKVPFTDNSVVTVTDNYWNNIVPTRTGSVNVNVLGTYSVCYNATDGSGNAAVQNCFNVEVKDTLAPTIALVGADTLTFDVFTTYTEPTPVISDNFYAVNTLTYNATGSFNRNKIGTYVITYTAGDNSGNTAIRYRVIKIVDREKPLLTLKDNSIIMWSLGKTPYVDPGVQVLDNYYSEKSLESLLQTTSTVNVFVPDAYTYTYKLTDSSGNVADPVTRTVIVTAGTGVQDLNSAGVVAYPNPATNVMNVYLGTFSTSASVTIKVVDMLGHAVLTEKVTDSRQLVSLDVAPLKSGMYMIIVDNELTNATQKINIIK